MSGVSKQIVELFMKNKSIQEMVNTRYILLWHKMRDMEIHHTHGENRLSQCTVRGKNVRTISIVALCAIAELFLNTVTIPSKQ